MTNHTNAAPSLSALFDNVPAELQPTPQPPHLIPATRISQVRGGRWVSVEVYMQYGRPISLDLALRRVQLGRTVFVAREDAEAVMGVANGGAP